MTCLAQPWACHFICSSGCRLPPAFNVHRPSLAFTGWAFATAVLHLPSTSARRLAHQQRLPFSPSILDLPLLPKPRLHRPCLGRRHPLSAFNIGTPPGTPAAIASARPASSTSLWPSLSFAISPIAIAVSRLPWAALFTCPHQPPCPSALPLVLDPSWLPENCCLEGRFKATLARTSSTPADTGGVPYKRPHLQSSSSPALSAPASFLHRLQGTSGTPEVARARPSPRATVSAASIFTSLPSSHNDKRGTVDQPSSNISH